MRGGGERERKKGEEGEREKAHGPARRSEAWDGRPGREGGWGQGERMRLREIHRLEFHCPSSRAGHAATGGKCEMKRAETSGKDAVLGYAGNMQQWDNAERCAVRSAKFGVD